jgi:hypothetical protein
MGLAIAAKILLIVLIIAVCLAAIVVARGASGVLGGGAAGTRRESQNLVVDALNLTHWWQKKKVTSVCDVTQTIADVAPVLRQRFPGRLVFVTKNRETAIDGHEAARVRAVYQEVANTSNVEIAVVERLPSDDTPRLSHASLGRDDFYLVMLAQRYRCGVLSGDRFRDLAEMKSGDLPPFHVYMYLPGALAPQRDFVNPHAPELAHLRVPPRFAYADLLAP